MGPVLKKERVRRLQEHKPQYGEQGISVLAAVWEAAGYPWSVRRKALQPSWMPWIRKGYRLSGEAEQQLLAMARDRSTVASRVVICDPNSGHS